MAGIPQPGLRAPQADTQEPGHLRWPQPLRPGHGRALRPDLLRHRARAPVARRLKAHMITPVILSGGAGTRLWPLSRELYPKQLLPLTGERTMLQQTVLRLEGLSAAPPVIVCNEAHRFLVAEQLRQLRVVPRA